MALPRYATLQYMSEDFVGNSEEEEGDDSEIEEISGDGSEDEGDEGVDGESWFLGKWTFGALGLYLAST